MKEEPEMGLLENRSLVKYKLLIDSACGWKEFQQRLTVLNDLAIKYHSDIASIAIGALIQSGQIDAAIVGLSPHNYATQNPRLAKLPIIDLQDVQEMATWPCNLHGDVYDEERNKNGTHAQVMKYNLNAT
jgi:hypothetical protein